MKVIIRVHRNKQNIKDVAHCVTRLRIVLYSNNKANIKL
ncbi:PTS transporter subunit EIIB [Clostridioides difficile]